MQFFRSIIHNIKVKPPFKQVHSELQKGMRLAKCRKCGCMSGTLENLNLSLPSLNGKEAKVLAMEVGKLLKKIEPLEYSCFGCKHCIPAEAMDILTSKFPSFASKTLSSCEFDINKGSWPPVAGEYTVLDRSASVAVSTLASVELEEKLARIKPDGLCIVGKTETENIGIDKVVKNIITNPAISFLVITGKDPRGHQTGKSLLALHRNGVNKNMRIVNSRGRRPILKNVSFSEVESFRRQVEVIDLIGCEDDKTIAKRIKAISGTKAVRSLSTCGCSECADEPSYVKISGITRIKASKPKGVKLDKAGYFVIIPSKEKNIITVEHYNYDNKLLRIIEGKNCRDIYRTIIDNNWITDLSHAAYIGKEICRAEIAMKAGTKYVQEGA